MFIVVESFKLESGGSGMRLAIHARILVYVSRISLLGRMLLTVRSTELWRPMAILKKLISVVLISHHL